MSQYWDKPTGECTPPSTQNVLLSESQAHCQSPAAHSENNQNPVPSSSSSSSHKAGDHPYLADITCLLNELGFEVLFLIFFSYT